MCVFVALVIQHTLCIRLSIVASSAVAYFSTLFLKGHDFQKEVAEHKLCVLIFCTDLSERFFHFKKNSARYYYKCA
jgi:hypothetical protein